MRIHVTGSHPAAKAVAGYLNENFHVTAQFSNFAICVDIGKPGENSILFDSVDGPLESLILKHIRVLTSIPIKIQTEGGNQSQNELHISVPPDATEDTCHAIERGVLRGFLDIAEQGRQSRQHQQVSSQSDVGTHVWKTLERFHTSESDAWRHVDELKASLASAESEHTRMTAQGDLSQNAERKALVELGECRARLAESERRCLAITGDLKTSQQESRAALEAASELTSKLLAAQEGNAACEQHCAALSRQLQNEHELLAKFEAKAWTKLGKFLRFLRMD